jgi:hypothetical protein
MTIVRRLWTVRRKYYVRRFSGRWRKSTKSGRRMPFAMDSSSVGRRCAANSELRKQNALNLYER